MAWGSNGAVFLGEDLMHNARDYSDETAHTIDEEVEHILRAQEERCRQTLTEHRNGLDLVARALLEHETISGDEVRRLIQVGENGGPDLPAPEKAGPAADAVKVNGHSTEPGPLAPPD
jgi:cell division protease FtsH